jgi:hypothetical protein
MVEDVSQRYEFRPAKSMNRFGLRANSGLVGNVRNVTSSYFRLSYGLVCRELLRCPATWRHAPCLTDPRDVATMSVARDKQK